MGNVVESVKKIQRKEEKLKAGEKKKKKKRIDKIWRL